uniref:Secreted protein n=1 Tax=Macrostomum lignano TaxID=282301 RepID=A0A1I8FDL0_9PLAT
FLAAALSGVAETTCAAELPLYLASRFCQAIEDAIDAFTPLTVRIVSSLHATLVTLLSAYALAFEEPLWSDKISAQSKGGMTKSVLWMQLRLPLHTALTPLLYQASNRQRFCPPPALCPTRPPAGGRRNCQKLALSMKSPLAIMDSQWWPGRAELNVTTLNANRPSYFCINGALINVDFPRSQNGPHNTTGLRVMPD